MKIYDISQEVFGCKVYPGDPAPKKTVLNSMENGDLYNLTEFSMCAHNGTHIDAPRHFVRDGLGIDELALDIFVGRCRVVSSPEELNCFENERLLLRGTNELSPSVAKALAQKNIKLFGIEGQSVGNALVHQTLLENGIVLLEGIRLDGVPDGEYTLFAAPLKLGGCDGAPCRAILLDDVN